MTGLSISAAPFSAADLAGVLDPEASGSMLPARAYTAADVLEFEREHFFRGGWVNAGRSADLVQAGARRAVRAAGDSILLVRDDDGRLRAFYNVCAHRGSELLACGAHAHRSQINCPYHAWTYALDGSLTATPRYEPPPGFDMSEHGLTPVRVEEWHGWAMVNLSGAAPPLADYLGDFETVLAPYGAADLVAAARHDYTMQANWKLAAENYQECFHCSLIHPELCRVSAPESGSNYDLTGAWVGGTMELAPNAETMSMSGESDGVRLPGLDDAQAREVVYAGLFPNFLVSLHPDYVMTHRIEPVSPGVSEVECEWLFAPEAVARPDFDPAYAVDFWDVTNRQDWTACENVQRGLASRGFRPGPFGVDEDAVQRLTAMVARGYLGQPLDAGANSVSGRLREGSVG